ncbi:hypothetical protein Tco_0561576 [Tanacetum coccineum]
MYDVTPPNTYSVQAPFGGVTDWYQEPRLYEKQVMAFSVILISSDSSEESVGTSTARVIFDTPDSPPSQDPYEVIVARWRSRVAARSSPTSSPIRQILPAPRRLPRRPAVLVSSGQPIPVGRPYRTQPSGVLQMLTARKRVGPLPTYRLALRYSANYSLSDQFTSDDSLRDSQSDSSSETSSDSYSDSSSDSSSRHSSSSYAISDSPFDSSIGAFGFLEDGYEPYVHRKVGLGVDVEDIYEPYTEPDVDSDIQADIDECIAYADAIRSRGTDDRDVVETAVEEEVESSARGTVKVEVDPRVRAVVDDDDVHESIREDVPDYVIADGAVEVTYETLGDLV